MAVKQPLVDLVHLCHLHGISQVVISPGSRSAALTIAFARHPAISCTVVMDERSAGFIALGMAQQLQNTVALVCTSGSAAYNFSPAVAEAFFQQVPLLVLTADRPKEWIHQNDGQTIYQEAIYGKNVKGFWNLPADYSHPDSLWYINRVVNEALLIAVNPASGPVHINVPIREPFYPKPDEVFIPSPNVRFIQREKVIGTLDTSTWHTIQDEWEDSDRTLIAVGQSTGDPELGKVLMKFAEEFSVPVLGEIISNIPTSDLKIGSHDLFLANASCEKLRPKLLITCGQSFLSKQLKTFFRDNPPDYHWHISEDLHIIDVFQSLTRHIPVTPHYFFSTLFESLDYQRFVQNEEDDLNEAYCNDWVTTERLYRGKIASKLYNLTVLNDLTAVKYVLDHLANPAQVHLANSMSVRYANMVGNDNQHITVYANRGTSGIDGCLSTAIGAALITECPVYCIIGDVAFLYDRNGLLIQYLPANLKIVLLNNAGGTIFRLINGPDQQPELNEFFETTHHFTGQRTAEDSGIDYYTVSTIDDLELAWPDFVASSRTSLLEVTVDPIENEKIYKEFRRMK